MKSDGDALYRSPAQRPLAGNRQHLPGENHPCGLDHSWKPDDAGRGRLNGSWRQNWEPGLHLRLAAFRRRTSRRRMLQCRAAVHGSVLTPQRHGACHHQRKPNEQTTATASHAYSWGVHVQFKCLLGGLGNGLHPRPAGHAGTVTYVTPGLWITWKNSRVFRFWDYSSRM
jgi:hypothetical protein